MPVYSSIWLFHESLRKVSQKISCEALSPLRVLFRLRPNLWITHRIQEIMSGPSQLGDEWHLYRVETFHIAFINQISGYEWSVISNSLG